VNLRKDHYRVRNAMQLQNTATNQTGRLGTGGNESPSPPTFVSAWAIGRLVLFALCQTSKRFSLFNFLERGTCLGIPARPELCWWSSRSSRRRPPNVRVLDGPSEVSIARTAWSGVEPRGLKSSHEARFILCISLA